jgi:hypothetical protein
LNIYINSIVKIHNDKRVKLGIVKEIYNDYIIVQGVFSRVIAVTYKVKKENVEVINLLDELGLE